MSADSNVALGGDLANVKIYADVKDAIWLDNGKSVEIKDNEVIVKPFSYGNSLSTRILRFTI
jgi:hypothetical protein